MRNLIIMLSLVLLFNSNVIADETVTNGDGKKILLKSNKTWEYVTEKKDDNIDNATNTHSVDCNNLIRESIDEINGKSTTIITDYIKIKSGKNILAIAGFNYINKEYKKRETVIILTIIENGYTACIERDAEINILFNTDDDDKKRVTQYSDREFNCKGVTNLHIDLKHPDSKLNNILYTDMKMMRFHTKDGIVDFKIDEKDAVLIRNSIKCLFDKL